MIILKDIDINDLDFSIILFLLKLDWNKRIITAPNDDLKDIQKQLKEIIEKSENEKFQIILLDLEKDYQ